MKEQQRSKGEEFLSLFLLAFIMSVLGFFAVLALNGDSLNKYISHSCNATVCVALKGNRADPDTVTVKLGETVQFNSADGKKHDIAIGEGGAHHEHTEGAPHSGVFGAKEGYRATFYEAGTFELHDHDNPLIHVTVKVYSLSDEK